MTIEQRYARAVSSSNLRLKDYPCDADLLIAAGWLKEGLSTEIYRLKVEFEGLDKKSLQNASRSMTDWVMVRSRLSSKDKAASYIASHAKQLAARAYRDISPLDAEDVAARVLGHMMMPVCQACEGREYDLIPGTKTKSERACKPCGGSGIKKLEMGKGLQREQFARHLQNDVERKLLHLMGLMAKYTLNSMNQIFEKPEAQAERMKGRAQDRLLGNPNDRLSLKWLGFDVPMELRHD